MAWLMYAENRPSWIGKNLWICKEENFGKYSIVNPLMLTVQDGGAATETPTLTDHKAVSDVDGFLQAALDCAWNLGMRPKGFADHTNELTAVRFHLEDMRKLAKVK